MNVIVQFDGTLEKRMGSNTQNAVIIANSAAAGFSPTGAITTNIIAYWKLDEVSGSRFDSIGGHELIDNNLVPSDAQQDLMSLVIAEICAYKQLEPTDLLTVDEKIIKGSSLVSTGRMFQCPTVTDHKYWGIKDKYGNPDIGVYFKPIDKKALEYYQELKMNRRMFQFAELLKK